ncbi:MULTISPECIES: hypothetical protein [unclassified Clostridium]|uniref:hypothetical protein n=1 Tax=unclassified Clostridium TaxID=2614128 RepID=UPI0025C59667|nr:MULTISPECIES: hypothetical protein [unclassified Clostridium]
MLNLITKEQQKYYFKLFKISIIGLFILIYFMAVVSRVENNADMQIYKNIFKFIRGVEVLLFTALSSMMHFKVSKENISRKELSLRFFSIGILTAIFMILGYIIVTEVFSITESIRPILNDSISFSMIIFGIKEIIITSIIVASVGIIGIWLSIEKKSLASNMTISMIIVILLETLINGLSLNIQLNVSIISAILAMILTFIKKKETT